MSDREHSTAPLPGGMFMPRGSVFVELAVTIIPFIMLVLVSMQGAVIGLTSLSLYYSTTRAAREASLFTADSAANRVAAIVAIVTGYAGGLGVDTSDLTVTVCPLLNPGCPGQDPAGGNQYFVISARKPLRFFLGLGSVTIGAKAVSRNEPV